MHEIILNNEIIDLFLKNNFYYFQILLQFKISESTRIPTAGVMFSEKDKRICLLYNKKFISKLTNQEIYQVLLHEVMHVVYQHIGLLNQTKYKSYPDKHRLNVAMDCVINSNKELTSLAKKVGVHPELFNLPLNETTEYYYQNLPEDIKDVKFDDHGDLDSLLSDEQKQQLDQVMQNAKRSAKLHNKGIPIEVDLININKINWRAILNNFVISSINSAKLNTRKKLNKRFGIQFPGNKKEKEFNLAIVLDTSGSMMTSLNLMVSHLDNMKKNLPGSNFMIIEADDSVQKVYEFNKNLKIKELSGGGGTMYQPAIDYCKADYDAIIYIGDMCCGDLDTLIKPKIPVLWANTEINTEFPKFGYKLRISK